MDWIVCNNHNDYLCEVIDFQEGKSLLIIAAEMGQELVMLSLLDSGADVAFKQEVTS